MNSEERTSRRSPGNVRPDAPTRVGIKVEMVEKNGKTKAVRTRVAKAKELNGAVID